MISAEKRLIYKENLWQSGTYKNSSNLRNRKRANSAWNIKPDCEQRSGFFILPEQDAQRKNIRRCEKNKDKASRRAWNRRQNKEETWNILHFTIVRFKQFVKKYPELKGKGELPVKNNQTAVTRSFAIRKKRWVMMYTPKVDTIEVAYFHWDNWFQNRHKPSDYLRILRLQMIFERVLGTAIGKGCSPRLCR